MRPTRQVALGLALLSAVVLTGACHRGNRQEPAPLDRPVTLYIRNNAYFDVNVYALPSTGVNPRVRLTTVGGNASAQVTVRATSLRPGGLLVVYVHPIGTRYYWTSPPVQVQSDVAACLEIHANPDGNLSRSSLYVAPLAVTADSAASAAVATVPVVNRATFTTCGG